MKKLSFANHFLPSGKISPCCAVYTKVMDRRSPFFPLHRHEDYTEFFYVHRGKGIHEANGATFALRTGSLVFVTEKDVHSFRVNPPDELAFTNVAFASRWWKLFRQLLSLNPTEHPIESLPFDLRHMTVEPGLRAGFERDLLHLMTAQPSEQSLWLLKAATHALMLFGSSQPKTPPAPDWLRNAVMLLDDPGHFRQGIRHFQKLAGCSPEHLARCCRRHFKCSPSEMINQSRIRHLQRELCVSRDKVLSLCYEAGFNNAGYFYRLFKKQAGCTPNQWRQRHLESLP
ncbi:MAG: AraC family transcriptional regulator [Verrucomicrobiae bacterium]|nr:AraC family transcriptional regulator [Verrucomicrobiae bacterium]